MDLTSQLSVTNRLAILRANDGNRRWGMLDEQRVCLGCARVFSGQEVRITTDAEGRCQLHCPTAGCESAPSDWFYYGSGLARDAGMTSPPGAEVDLNFG